MAPEKTFIDKPAGTEENTPPVVPENVTGTIPG